MAYKKFCVGFFKILWENRQSTFHEFKFSVCLHTPTLNFKIWNLVCLFFYQIFKYPAQNVFYAGWQNRKSQLFIDGLIISVQFLTFGVRKWQKFFCKMSQKVFPECLFEFRISICDVSIKDLEYIYRDLFTFKIIIK